MNTLHLPALTDALFSMTREGLLVLNASDEIDRVNEVALQLLQADTPDMLNGRNFTDIFADRSEGQKFLEALAHNGQLRARTLALKQAGGQPFSVSCSAVLVGESDVDAVQRIIFLHNTTDSKDTKDKLAAYTTKLEKKNKELDQFAYIVSHDLKAPLRAVSNLSLWLQEDLGDSLEDENKTNLTMLRNRVLRLESLINGILEYSKIGRIELITETVDVYLLLEEVIDMLSPRAGVDIRMSDKMPVFEAPKVMLFQVFSNLIGNAIKYNDKSETVIEVSCTDTGPAYEFAVEDNGPGISPEFFESIFVIFQTLQSRDKVESTGIGLTIVKRIIDDLGGKIWVESEVGRGSKFTFSWPKEPTL